MNESNLCPPTEAHAPRLISHASIGQVAQCNCGHLHLTLQYLTLRFEPDAFRELAALLEFAQRRLDREAQAAGAQPADGACRPVH
jgi:hypothetical protein